MAAPRAGVTSRLGSLKLSAALRSFAGGRAISSRRLVPGMLVVLLALAAPAWAAIAFTPTSPVITGPVSNTYTWTYTPTLNTGESLTATVPGGSCDPGASPCGSFFTIYDFVGYVPNSATAPTGWSVSVQLIGLTPSSVTPTDSASVVNLTFSYTGSSTIVGTGQTLGSFSAGSTTDIENTNGLYSYQTNSANPPDQGDGHIPVPGTAPTSPPHITSAASTNFVLNQSSTFTVTTTGTPIPSISDGGATLPNGVNFADNNDGTATLSGIPTQTGTFPITFTASNGVNPDATQNFTLTVSPPTPFIDIVSPAAVAPGSTPSSLTIFGANFLSDSTVSFNGSTLTPATVTANEIVVNGLSALPATGTTLPVTVVNPTTAPLVGTSNVAFFPVTTATASVGTSRTNYGSSNTGSSIVVADFENLGNLDLAVANYNANTVSILQGSGAGSFALGTSPATGNGPQALAVGDFNGDGYLDLVAANFIDNTVSILLNNADGTGTFQAQTTFATGNEPCAVAVGDFNRDGKLDLAVANCGDNYVSILLGNGNGSFQSQTTVAAGTEPVSIALGDFNGDGKLDLAVVNFANNTVGVLLGNGDGTFQSQATYATGNQPQSVVVGDFNHDGYPDLAVANYVDGTVSIFINKADGTGAFLSQATAAAGTEPISIAVGDFNGDGILDLAVANSGANTLGILLGNGSGAFTAAAAPAVSTYPDAVAVGDFNNDGRLDFATAHIGSSTATVLLQSSLAVAGPANGLSFGNQTVNTVSAPMNATLTNNGSKPLMVTSVTASAEFNTTTNCVGSLQPGAGCTEQVTFAPTATGPTSGAVLTFTDDSGGNAGSTQSVSLSGTGTSGVTTTPIVASSLAFGDVDLGTSESLKLTVTNTTSSSSFKITNIAFNYGPGAGKDFGYTTQCGGSLKPGKSCTITVTLKAQDLGAANASLLIYYNQPGSPASVALSGTVTNPKAKLSKSSLSFGNVKVNESSTLSVVLTSSGSTALTINSITVSGSTNFTTSTCASPLNPNATCTINVTFTPTAKKSYSGTLKISDNASSSPQTVSLSGKGD